MTIEKARDELVAALEADKNRKSYRISREAIQEAVIALDVVQELFNSLDGYLLREEKE